MTFDKIPQSYYEGAHIKQNVNGYGYYEIWHRKCILLLG